MTRPSDKTYLSVLNNKRLKKIAAEIRLIRHAFATIQFVASFNPLQLVSMLLVLIGSGLFWLVELFMSMPKNCSIVL